MKYKTEKGFKKRGRKKEIIMERNQEKAINKRPLIAHCQQGQVTNQEKQPLRMEEEDKYRIIRHQMLKLS